MPHFTCPSRLVPSHCQGCSENTMTLAPRPAADCPALPCTLQVLSTASARLGKTRLGSARLESAPRRPRYSSPRPPRHTRRHQDLLYKERNQLLCFAWLRFASLCSAGARPCFGSSRPARCEHTVVPTTTLTLPGVGGGRTVPPVSVAARPSRGAAAHVMITIGCVAVRGSSY